MNKFQIFTDGGADITDEESKKLNLGGIAPLLFSIDGKEYTGFNKEPKITSDEFYKMLSEGKSVITSQANASQFEEHFKKALDKGFDVLYIGISAALSGTVQSATIARDMLLENYPDRKILIVDSVSISEGIAILVREAARLRDEGINIEKIKEKLDELKLKICHWIVVDDLMFLKRGGRLSGAAAFAGSLLNLKPIITLTDEGKLDVIDKVRGMKKTFRTLIEKAKAEAEVLKGGEILVGHAGAREEALELKQLIEKEGIVNSVRLFELGPALGAHVGPGTIAFGYVGTKRGLV